MPSFGRSRSSYDASAKEQKQVLADINAGSQKFGRKLLAKPPQKRGKSDDDLTPVTVLSPGAGGEEERKGRNQGRRGRGSSGRSPVAAGR
ncbi:hypothetical protein EJ04DRAFT_149787 [Polyplosphaeria fusca]|uniref:Uncharacterized protein n=1 Tax=Polyplosphaeria fusca TaxID=682080 RepID=A0A9P4QZJ2_9PLEO|nr:hypothetical protein EJ04DRAFT_149787 [Polyplosphaeria fusca]